MFMDRVNVQSGTAALNLNLQPNEVCTGFSFNSTHNGQHSNNAIFYPQHDARVDADGYFRVSYTREANDGNAGFSLTCTVVKIELVLN